MSKKERSTITIDKELLDKFKKLCDDRGFKIGKTTENLIKEFINKNKD